jgi:hypothetical protein
MLRMPVDPISEFLCYGVIALIFLFLCLILFLMSPGL